MPTPVPARRTQCECAGRRVRACVVGTATHHYIPCCRAANNRRGKSSLESKVPKFRDQRPGRPDGLLAILDGKGARPALVELVRGRLRGGERYHSTHELLEAVRLAHVEEEPGT